MTPFTRLTGIAAPLPVANVDTDMLLPARFLKTVSRKGLGAALFRAQRFDANDVERPDFPLNRRPWRHAEILVALDNFGCGSSREHAPWALRDFGIRCIIAPSFADIFYGNCFKNGMLPVVLGAAQVEVLMADAEQPETAIMTVDLEQRTITRTQGETIGFSIDPQRRQRLLDGVDDIAQSLAFEEKIAAHERGWRIAAPWIRGLAADFAKTETSG
ncbi:3-isopropylmalate dehydratase small subunit [Sphingomonas bacterium]|uniref:3-isopropylmalate dehydratase small subunit n=1 Tax=Sphingomonas bacterium TaxID=1895847 RepID=UPI0015758A64|nr:3-isopropylmalate dehydratase small subunit [Sphingomonas bacterium]